MPFYSSNAAPINSSDSTKNITIQVSSENQKIRPCAFSDYTICTVELNQSDAPYGILTITNSGGVTISNIDVGPITNSTILMSATVISRTNCSTVIPGGPPCVIRFFQFAAGTASELLDITGNGVVLGQFILSIS
jgi:hypothetical protein